MTDRLFDDLPERWYPEPGPRISQKLSRTEHPDTSKMAARHLAATTLGEKEQQAFSLIRIIPGNTAKELEDGTGHGDGEIRKRLNGLRLQGRAHKGPKRKCRVTGRMAYTWYPGPQPKND